MGLDALSMSARPTGQLFYIIGASGVGKDSLLNYARETLNGSTDVFFAHRYITRQPSPETENHIYLSEAEFLSRSELGCFTLEWHGNNLYYGIGKEIDFWLNSGVNVVVNGSRSYLGEACQSYPDLIPIMIDVPLGVLGTRLHKRGRESQPEIEQRLRRAAAFKSLQHSRMIVIDNSGSLQEAGERLTHELTRQLAGRAE